MEGGEYADRRIQGGDSIRQIRAGPARLVVGKPGGRHDAGDAPASRRRCRRATAAPAPGRAGSGGRRWRRRGAPRLRAPEARPRDGRSARCRPRRRAGAPARDRTPIPGSIARLRLPAAAMWKRWPMPSRVQRRVAAQGIAFRRLDLDDGRAELGQQAAAHGDRPARPAFDNDQIVKCSSHDPSSPVSAVPGS